MNIIYVVSGESETNDHYGPIFLSKKPNDELLKKIAYSWDGDSEENGLGDYGSYIYLEVKQVEVDKID